jgi:hypothetical protein
MDRARTSRSVRARTVGTAAAVAFLAGSCGMADALGDGPPDWDDISDYSFTLEYFQGACDGPSRGRWSITVHDDKATDAKPLNALAEESSWPEGAPTLKALYAQALGFTRSTAADDVRFTYDDGRYDRRPTSFYYLDSDGSERCQTYTEFRPLPASSD